jgi:hypothetical protein
VILNWNGAEMMRRYLPSVIKYSQGADIIVADNASTDNSLKVLKREFPEVKVITLEKNWGFAEGYNKALSQIDTEYYLLLNSDVRVEEGWLTPMMIYMSKNLDVAACQPKLLSDINPKMFEYAGACGGYIDRYGYPFCRGRIFNTVEQDMGQYDDIADIQWATGACLMIRREDYWNAGGLDARFFAHNEEIDLCWRLRSMGKRIVCIPQSKVYHLGGGTLPQGNPRKTYLNFRNNLTMLYKNLPKKELDSTMCIRAALDYIAALQALIISRSKKEFKAILKARKDFHAWKEEFASDRQKIQSASIAAPEECRTMLSILWEYYVKGNKTFSSLKNFDIPSKEHQHIK